MPKTFSKKLTSTLFQKRIYKVVKKISPGSVLSYKEVARLAGRPKAWRAVGNVLNKCPGSKAGVPCHRVIRSDGRIGGYNRGTKNKIYLLKKEGVIIQKRKVVP